MLPVGHVAGGFLAAKVGAIFIPELNQPYYLGLAGFFGFFPDLDYFAVFWRSRKFTDDGSVSHRNFFSHGPLLYLLAFAIWILLFPESKLIAICFLAGTMSHFILDTVSGAGIMWLYPFSSRRFGFAVEEKIPVDEKRFFKYWTQFVSEYSKKYALKAEVAIIVLALLTFYI